jgi:hypothetical protein
MRKLAFASLLFGIVAAISLPAYGAEPGTDRQHRVTGIPVAYPSAPTLFQTGETAASFLLRDPNALNRPSPEKELLHNSANQQAIAALLKEERNKGLKPGMVAPDDKDSLGIKVRFDGIRFLQDKQDPSLVRVRLVGPVNEVECKQPLSIATLLTAKEPIPIQFQSVTKSTGVTVTITTDVKLQFKGDSLDVSETKGSIDFSVGRFSPARLMYSSDFDRVELPSLVGQRVSEDVLPFRSLLEPEKL